jgi:hypothetical protein
LAMPSVTVGAGKERATIGTAVAAGKNNVHGGPQAGLMAAAG